MLNKFIARSKFVICSLIFSCFCPTVRTVAQTIPEEPDLSAYNFNDTNWNSAFGYAPIGFTNLVSVPVLARNALLLDTTNAAPAFLNYNVVETNGWTNIAFDAGAIECVFICNWATADTNQDGSGPGATSYLVAAGDFSSNSPDGLWGIWFDAGGSNIYFGGLSNSTTNVFVSAPISWPSNSVHQIGLAYSTNTVLYIDGELAATGGPVTIVPSTNVWTNGFFIGSDSSGYEQARAVFWQMQFYDSVWFDYNDTANLTNNWGNISNEFAAALGGSGGTDFASGLGSLHSLGGSGGCVTGSDVYFTDLSYSNTPSGGNTFTFTIAGGQPGSNYDVFATAELAKPLSSANWTWLGQATNCGIYSVTNQSSIATYYVLGNATPASDGSGLSVAYERLITGPVVAVQPLSQTNARLSTVTFTVTVVGKSPLSYQWQFNGANISQATGTSYSISSATGANSGVYSVVVTNAYSSVTSSNANLIINPPNGSDGVADSYKVNHGEPTSYVYPTPALSQIAPQTCPIQ